jgi:hypothetical protein
MKGYLEINASESNGILYYSFENRGTSYTLCKINNGWELWSKRLAASFDPTIRFFSSVKEIESKIKSLRGISSLIN